MVEREVSTTVGEWGFILQQCVSEDSGGFEMCTQKLWDTRTRLWEYETRCAQMLNDMLGFTIADTTNCMYQTLVASWGAKGDAKPLMFTIVPSRGDISETRVLGTTEQDAPSDEAEAAAEVEQAEQDTPSDEANAAAESEQAGQSFLFPRWFRWLLLRGLIRWHKLLI